MKSMLNILLKNRFLALLDQFAGQSKGKKAATLGYRVGFAVLGVLVVIGIALGMNALLGPTMCVPFAQAGMGWLFFAFVALFAVIGSLFLTLFYAQGAIFEAKDNELLLSMPIRPSAILASRMGSLYFLNLFISLALMGGAGYTFANNGGIFSAGGVLILVLGILLLPLVSTTLSCLVGWLISVITRHMRNKTPVQMLLYLIGFGAFYFLLNGANAKLQAFANDPSGMISAFRSGLYPFYALGIAVTEANFLQMLVFSAFCIIPFGIVYYVLSVSFIKIVTARSAAKKARYEATALRSSSVTWAMTKKDLARFFNSPSYMFNAGLGILYTMGMGVFALFSGNSLTKGLIDQTTDAVNPGAVLTLVNAMILAFVACVTSISAVSISAESKNLWILKSMPVRAKDVLTGKFLSHILLAGPASVFASFLYLLSALLSGTAPDLTGILVLFLLPLAANVFCALSGLIFNLLHGKVDFPSIAKATKSSAAIIPMLAILLVLGLPMLLWLMVLQEAGISVHLMVVIVTALVIALDAPMYFFLGSGTAQKRWDKLGQ